YFRHKEAAARHELLVPSTGVWIFSPLAYVSYPSRKRERRQYGIFPFIFNESNTGIAETLRLWTEQRRKRAP
ncbi:MAG: hypothetical protein M3Y57_08710, partial [Acidobacteriota bacterium]|nr:hypothetical protein [Acidobacteriota bacterium]